MELASVLFLLAVLILVGMFLYAPLIGRARRENDAEQHELSASLAERDRIINALQELDFDHSLGKIPAEDYPRQRADLMEKGIEVLRRVDALTLPAAGPGQRNGRGSEARTRLEQAAAARRADGGSPSEASAAAGPARSDDDLESLISARRGQRTEKSGGFCPRCGQAVLLSDRFCPSCGKAL